VRFRPRFWLPWSAQMGWGSRISVGGLPTGGARARHKHPRASANTASMARSALGHVIRLNLKLRGHYHFSFVAMPAPALKSPAKEEKGLCPLEYEFS